MSLKKKYQKLLRDPKLFMSDMVIKHRKMINQLIGRKKFDGKNQFTVVSAVYGVEKYLDDYFESLVKQNLDFKKHIHLVMVDDGSKDNSAEIIKKWQKKYPDNITYIYKENGGQASARNLGLEYVKTKWVTFIDPDDFVDENYFLNIELQIESSDDSLILIATNVVYFLEKNKIYRDMHPLKYRYLNNNPIPIVSSYQNFQLSASASVLQYQKINQLRFNPKLNVAFEDADFINRYLFENTENNKIVFLKTASYFYRKREALDSSIDTVFAKKDFYLSTLEEGCLKLLKDAQVKHERVPTYVQCAVLYHLIGYFKRYVNNQSISEYLSEEEIQHFISILRRIFNKIDENVIFSFSINNTKMLYRVAFIEFFKQKKSVKNNFYIEKYDFIKKQILLSFNSFFEKDLLFFIDNKIINPIIIKKIKYQFCSNVICYEYKIWLPINKLDKHLQIKVDDVFARIICKNNFFKTTADLNLIVSSLSTNYTPKEKYWIIMDRNDSADDNAEHFYRYIKKTYPNQFCYFALNNKSPDWVRLNNEGFNLVNFGSKKFYTLLSNAENVISSHLQNINFFMKNNINVNYVFLQHGVIHNDHSSIYNNKNIRLFITTTYDEYNAIAGNNSLYSFTPKEVILSGMPRHDILLKNNKLNSKTIVVMPTWRQYLVGKLSGKGLEREYNNEFLETEYARCWSNFLCSSNLEKLLGEFDYKVIFVPHPEIKQYVKDLNIPSYVDVWDQSRGSIQQVLQESALMITDYSSIAFDMAVLNKMVIYYQFDQEDFYGLHYKKSYFDYNQDGFGPIVFNSDMLFAELRNILILDCNLYEPFKSRIQGVFPYRDGNNCERIYQAIIDINTPDDNGKS